MYRLSVDKQGHDRKRQKQMSNAKNQNTAINSTNREYSLRGMRQEKMKSPLLEVR